VLVSLILRLPSAALNLNSRTLFRVNTVRPRIYSCRYHSCHPYACRTY